MRTAIAALLIAGATIFAAPLAYADGSVTAQVLGIDTGKHEIGLDNGKMYAATPDVLLNKFKPGDKVTVTFTDATAGMTANGIAGLVTQITATK